MFGCAHVTIEPTFDRVEGIAGYAYPSQLGRGRGRTLIAEDYDPIGLDHFRFCRMMSLRWRRKPASCDVTHSAIRSTLAQP
ncbi:hypothetical protein CUJ84_pRLN3000255 (plasmid) [Rhizobium leguminosarum]|uniref:Uncharacterized protein n=1 Tax=Rhizobium leguminosarum TaxID=384 RepID=A0A2K9ZGJ9_RHILE|nr:hypothetical protein CUJ84_pRLN3000255 [Rhizobium leguminosarum]